MFMDIVAVAVAPVTLTLDCTEHVGAGVLAVDTLHARFTVPVKPFVAVIVIVVDVEPPAVTLAELGLAAMVKLPVTAVTVKFTVVVWVVAPETPLIVT